jgi:hypothetical protein
LGQKLEFISINELIMWSLLRSTLNLKSIEINDSFAQLIEQYLPKLREIKVSNILDNNSFKSFADLYHKQIWKYGVFSIVSPEAYLDRGLTVLIRISFL